MAKKNKKKRQKQQLENKLAVLQNPNASKAEKRRARKYVKMKTTSNQRIEPVPKPEQFDDVALEKSKKELNKLFAEANSRIENIKSRGYTSYAIDRVEHEGGSEYFSIDGINDRDTLLKELYRVRTFLNDKGSTMEGAFLETAQISSQEYKGKFGNQYNTEEFGYSRFDTTVIDKDVASRAFASYRRIEEHRASEIVNEGAYGSENLIIALYDAEIRGMDSLSYGEDLLDVFAETHKLQWENARQESNSIVGISGIIEDNITGGWTF